MKVIITHIILAHILAHYALEAVDMTYTPINFSWIMLSILGVLWLLSGIYNRDAFRKFPLLIELLFFFLKEMVVANIRVAMDAITPVHRMEPGVIALPLEAKTDLEITILANLISLTPGTLSLDISKDRTKLFVHTIYMDEGSEALKQRIKNGFEKKILKLSR